MAGARASAIGAARTCARRLLGVCCLLLGASLAVRGSAAEPPRILVLERAGAGELEQETLSRLKGELRSLDFEVITLELDAARDPEEAVDSEGRQLGPFAALALAARGSGLRLWLSDRLSRQISVQDWTGEDARLPATVAVQGVELVRARLAASLDTPPAVPDVVAHPLPSPASPGAPGLRFELQAGLGLAFEPRAQLTSTLPLVRLLITRRLQLLGTPLSGGLRLGAGAFGSTLRFEATGGRATVAQSLALLDLWLGLWPEARVTPFVALGGGVVRRRIAGNADAGYVGQTRDVVSPLASAGLGLFSEIVAPLGVSLDAQGLFAAQPARVRIDSREVATLGRPSLLLSLALVLAP
jgi:hypothetical protein